MTLTQRQTETLRLIDKYGDDYIDEGTIASELWPLILRPRRIANALYRGGLITFGDRNDEGGYQLVLTDAGRTSVRAMA